MPSSVSVIADSKSAMFFSSTFFLSSDKSNCSAQYSFFSSSSSCSFFNSATRSSIILITCPKPIFLPCKARAMKSSAGRRSLISFNMASARERMVLLVTSTCMKLGLAPGKVFLKSSSASSSLRILIVSASAASSPVRYFTFSSKSFCFEAQFLSRSSKNLASSASPSAVSPKSFFISWISTPRSPTRVSFCSIMALRASTSFFFCCHQALIINNSCLFCGRGICKVSIHFIKHCFQNACDFTTCRCIFRRTRKKRQNILTVSIHHFLAVHGKLFHCGCSCSLKKRSSHSFFNGCNCFFNTSNISFGFGFQRIECRIFFLSESCCLRHGCFCSSAVSLVVFQIFFELCHLTIACFNGSFQFWCPGFCIGNAFAKCVPSPFPITHEFFMEFTFFLTFRLHFCFKVLQHCH